MIFIVFSPYSLKAVQIFIKKSPKFTAHKEQPFKISPAFPNKDTKA
jgi:hypothetical protein